MEELRNTERFQELDELAGGDCDCWLEEMLEFLDELRESGATNMFAARTWLVDEFYMTDEKLAGKILVYWMETFGERHQGEE